MATTTDTGTPIQSLVTSIFGAAFTWVRGFNLNPLLGAVHHGIDVAAPIGTPVRAVSAGTVVYAGDPLNINPHAPYVTLPNGQQQLITNIISGEGGNQVLVYTATGKIEIYAHLNQITAQAGQVISQGGSIGTVGDTGITTGPHLHFGVFDPATQTDIDPLPYLRALPTVDELGAWNNIVSFPVGHVLTVDDVNNIIAALDSQHWFQSANTIPGLQQLNEDQARNTVRAILMAHATAGDAWSPALEQTLQTQIFGAANSAADPLGIVTGLNNFGNTLSGLLLKGLVVLFAIVLIYLGAKKILDNVGD